MIALKHLIITAECRSGLHGDRLMRLVLRGEAQEGFPRGCMEPHGKERSALDLESLSSLFLTLARSLLLELLQLRPTL